MRPIRVPTSPAPAGLATGAQRAWRGVQRLRQVRAALDQAPAAVPSVCLLLAWWQLEDGKRTTGGSKELPVQFEQVLMSGEAHLVRGPWAPSFFVGTAAGNGRLALDDAVLLEAALDEAEALYRDPSGVPSAPDHTQMAHWLLGLTDLVEPDYWFVADGQRTRVVPDRPARRRRRLARASRRRPSTRASRGPLRPRVSRWSRR